MGNGRQTAIVTGASRGIGAGLVGAFLKRGYSVVANSRNITKANPFAAAANVALVDGDIGHPSTAATIVDTAVSRFGRIDVLINNAGVFGSIDISIKKAYTSRAFEIETKELAKHSQSGVESFGVHVSNNGKIMICAGGIPLKLDGKVVGAIGVSGGSGDQDHAVASSGAAAF
jgi:uncharacterized protein GlcG (DUF336 family)